MTNKLQESFNGIATSLKKSYITMLTALSLLQACGPEKVDPGRIDIKKQENVTKYFGLSLEDLSKSEGKSGNNTEKNSVTVDEINEALHSSLKKACGEFVEVADSVYKKNGEKIPLGISISTREDDPHPLSYYLDEEKIGQVDPLIVERVNNAFEGMVGTLRSNGRLERSGANIVNGVTVYYLQAKKDGLSKTEIISGIYYILLPYADISGHGEDFALMTN